MMLKALQVLATIVVAVTFAATLAHAMELPGKLRLPRDQYLVVQPIYYPGFTIAGISEPVGLLILIALTVLTPAGPALWLTIGALVALAGAVATYWLVTHPVNNFWLSETELAGASKRFFAIGTGEGGEGDWKALRDRWEYSHVLRAAFASISLLLLVTAIAIA